MATSDTITASKQLEYNECWWGESIYGTKEQLQGLGIAIGRAFPGEPGGSKRELNVIDPRGFKTSITRWSHDSVYSASIHFPGRSSIDKKQWSEYAPEVRLSTNSTWCDEYVGTSEALSAAGLVRPDQLPGQPGMRKVIVTIFADGTMPEGALRAKYKRANEPGAKAITRASKTMFRVRVVIQDDMRERREEAYQRSKREHHLRMWALPRPRRLDGKRNDHAQSKASVTTPDKYRDHVTTMAAMALGMIERWMFNDKAMPFSFAPEERERLLGHTKSIWQDLSRLIDQGKVIRKNSDLRPALRLVRSVRT